VATGNTNLDLNSKDLRLLARSPRFGRFEMEAQPAGARLLPLIHFDLKRTSIGIWDFDETTTRLVR
jgi:hypothetical protein